MERKWDTLSHGKNSKTLIHQPAYDALEEEEKEGKYSSESMESYFTLFELLLAPKLQKDISSQIHRKKKQPLGMQSFWAWTVNRPETKP